MDQQSLQALLQELRGFDEAPPAPAQALLDTNTSEAVSGASDYTAWYEDYVKSADVSSSTATAATVASDFSSNGTSVQPPTTTTPRDAPVDLRKLTYAQALPIISALARDETFLDALQDVRSDCGPLIMLPDSVIAEIRCACPLLQLKSTQETFELSLLDERNQAKHDLEKQLKKARESATVSGVQYEVEVGRLQ